MVKPKNIDKRIKCENCGHTHITEVGDLGKEHDQFGLDRIPECFECHCYKFKHKKLKNIK